MIAPFANNQEQLLQLAEEATQAKDWPKAIKFWRKLIRKFGKTTPPETWFWLTHCYVQQEDLHMAERIADEGIKRHPKLTKLLILAAKIASSQESWQRAKECWTLVIESVGDKAPSIAWASLAKAHRMLNQLEQAEFTIEKGLVRHPNDLEILIGQAEIVTAQKDWPAALDLWSQISTIINKQDEPNLTTKQEIRFNNSVIKRLVNITDYTHQIRKYSQSKEKRRIAVVTSMTKGYDSLKPPEVLDDRFDYIVYTNENLDTYGIFKIHPLPKPELDDGRAIRYVKTHPHVLFKDYDAVVWVDSSLMIVGDIYPLIQKFLDSKLAVGSGVHPLRNNIYEEFEANVRLQKENPKIMKKQIAFYKSQGFEHDDLAENTLLMFNIANKKLAPALETWWDQICRFSKRDQLSFNYSLTQNGVEWFKLTQSPENIRNHPDFVITAHHSHPQVLDELGKALKA